MDYFGGMQWKAREWKKVLNWPQRKRPWQDPHRAEGGASLRDIFNYKACDKCFIASLV